MRDLVGNYLALARRGLMYWKRGVAVFLVVLTAGMVYVVQRPRTYKSEAVLDMELPNPPAPGESRPAEEIKSEVENMVGEVFGVAPNQETVIRELNLYPQLSEMLHRRKEFQTAVRWRVDAPRRLTLWFLHRDKEVPRRVVTRLLQLYREKRRESQTGGARNRLETLSQQIATLERSLAERDEYRERYYAANRATIERIEERRRSGRTVVVTNGRVDPGTSPGTPSAPALEPGASVRTRMLSRRVTELRREVDRLQRPPENNSNPDSDTARGLRDQVRESDERLRGLRRQYTDQAPQVQQEIGIRASLQSRLDAEVRRLRAQSEAERSLSGAERTARLNRAQSELAEVQGQLGASIRADQQARNPTAVPQPGTTADAGTVPAVVIDQTLVRNSEVQVEQEWETLEGERTNALEQLRRFQTQRATAQADLAAVQAEPYRMLVEPRLPEEPEPPGRTKLAMIAFAVSLILGLAVALISGFLDSKVYEASDVTRWGEIPDLPFIPDLHEDGASARVPTGPGGPPGGAGPPPPGQPMASPDGG